VIRFVAGELRLSVLDAGRIWLDGGAMFGVVPRVLWQRERPPDEQNRICLAMNLLLIEDGRQRILVDTGAGDKWDGKGRSLFGLTPIDTRRLLEPAGIVPEQIDVVINTHLHFDHAGGNTRRDGSGRLLAAFPNAEYVVQRGELELARWDNERIRASYQSDNFEPLVAERRLRLVDGDTDFTRHLRLRVVPGHTPHMQMALVAAGGTTVAFPADLVPTASHVPYPYIMGYDLEPLVTLTTKKRVFPEAVREHWRIVFEHDAELPVGVLEEREGRIRARAVELEG
jgi:glyoxylase-like metal-dependent hydrolase (beta-lactamase superfamily II)